jgi:hypothetical protein
MTEKEIFETLVFNSTLTQLVARVDFIKWMSDYRRGLDW